MRIVRPWSARPVLLVLCLLSWTFLPAHAQNKSDSVPSGLVVVIENTLQKGRSLDLRALNNPFISGVALQIHWCDIEPVQGKPDWSKLDELFAAAESSKKWVHLLVFPGFFAPAWALEGAKTEQFPIQYGPGKGTVLSLPMPWDTVYLTRWFAFLKQLADRYGKSPAFRLIGAAGPTSVSVEMTLPFTPEDLRKWQSDSYTPSRYVETWKKVFQVYATDFPDQYVSLSLGLGLAINDQGAVDAHEHMRTRQAVIDQAIGVLGRRFVLQMSDVHAGPGPRGHDSEKEDQVVINYSGRYITGLQMRSSAERGSAVMGTEGDPPTSLKNSIDYAMEPNKDGQHINYLEIYEPDVLADEMKPVLRDGASLFTRGQLPEGVPVAGPSVRGDVSGSSGNMDPGEERPGTKGKRKQHDQEQGSLRRKMPYGLSVVNHVDANRTGKLFETNNPTLNAYANPNTAGVTFRTSWADIEPQEGTFDFTKLDTVFANAEKNGKWVELILIPGFGTPAWALEGVQSATFAISYGRGSGTMLPLPAPWDQTYLSRWFTFLKAIGDRYGGKALFRKIAAAGPTSVSAEMSLPESEDEIAQWEKLGYTSEKYVRAWKQTFAAYASTFPNQYFSLALHPALPIPDKSQKTSVRDQVISLGLQYPSQFALQEDGLNAARVNKAYGYRAVQEHSGQIATGFMMTTAASEKSERMGAAGDPAEALRKSINHAMAPNTDGKRIDYLEIYEPDVLADEMQPVLRYGASLFTR